MNGPRSEAKQLAVHHVGHPSQRLPVTRVADLKTPREGAPGESAVDKGIAVNVNVIIEIDEVESRDRPVDNHCPQGEERDNQIKWLFVRIQ
jgi:hypothetical protein